MRWVERAWAPADKPFNIEELFLRPTKRQATRFPDAHTLQEIDSDACTSDSGSESESDSDSSSTSDASSSDSGADEDDPKRTRFGSLPLSSGASGEQRWEPIKFVRRPRAGPPAQHPSNLPAASPVLSGAMLGSSAEAAPGAFVAGASMSSDGGFGSLPATERGAAWAALRWPRDGPVPMSCTPGT